ncbi:unnamed protein product [Zymoseptoria tritici ST99CH_3D1]|nr:unnamed protein product [Zymoseptoria tritici ST99CH_3D1]
MAKRKRLTVTSPTSRRIKRNTSRPSKHPHGQIDPDKEYKEYKVRDIIGETKTKYYVNWEDDSKTGEQYVPFWEPKDHVNELAVESWIRKQAAKSEKTGAKGKSTLQKSAAKKVLKETPAPAQSTPRRRPKRVIDSSPTDNISSVAANVWQIRIRQIAPEKLGYLTQGRGYQVFPDMVNRPLSSSWPEGAKCVDLLEGFQQRLEQNQNVDVALELLSIRESVEMGSATVAVQLQQIAPECIKKWGDMIENIVHNAEVRLEDGVNTFGIVQCEVKRLKLLVVDLENFSTELRASHREVLAQVQQKQLLPQIHYELENAAKKYVSEAVDDNMYKFQKQLDDSKSNLDGTLKFAQEFQTAMDTMHGQHMSKIQSKFEALAANFRALPLPDDIQAFIDSAIDGKWSKLVASMNGRESQDSQIQQELVALTAKYDNAFIFMKTQNDSLRKRVGDMITKVENFEKVQNTSSADPDEDSLATQIEKLQMRCKMLENVAKKSSAQSDEIEKLQARCNTLEVAAQKSPAKSMADTSMEERMNKLEAVLVKQTATITAQQQTIAQLSKYNKDVVKPYMAGES